MLEPVKKSSCPGRDEAEEEAEEDGVLQEPEGGCRVIGGVSDHPVV